MESLSCLCDMLRKPPRDKHPAEIKFGFIICLACFFPLSLPSSLSVCLFQYMWSVCQTLLIRLRINPSEMLIPLRCTVQLSWDQDSTAVGLTSWTEHIIVQPCRPCHCKIHLRLNASHFQPFEEKNILRIKMSLCSEDGGNQISLRADHLIWLIDSLYWRELYHATLCTKKILKKFSKATCN